MQSESYQQDQLVAFSCQRRYFVQVVVVCVIYFAEMAKFSPERKEVFLDSFELDELALMMSAEPVELQAVVFVEGEKGGKDHAIYQSIYRNYHVVPRSGCQRVIESVRALKLNASFHHISVFGLIDRDYRTDAEIQGLADSGGFCIDVAEIENIHS